jgi:hypothetical protein
MAGEPMLRVRHVVRCSAVHTRFESTGLSAPTAPRCESATRLRAFITLLAKRRWEYLGAIVSGKASVPDHRVVVVIIKADEGILFLYTGGQQR